MIAHLFEDFQHRGSAPNGSKNGLKPGGSQGLDVVGKRWWEVGGRLRKGWRVWVQSPGRRLNLANSKGAVPSCASFFLPSPLTVRVGGEFGGSWGWEFRIESLFNLGRGTKYRGGTWGEPLPFLRGGETSSRRNWGGERRAGGGFSLSENYGLTDRRGRERRRGEGAEGGGAPSEGLVGVGT